MHERRAGLAKIGTSPAEEVDFLALRPHTRAKLVSFGKAVAYLLIAAIGMLLVSALAKGVWGANLLEMAQAGLGMGTLRALLLLIAVVVVPTAVMLAQSRAPLKLSGWSLDGAPRLAGIGAATGFGLLTAIAAILWAAGAVRFEVSAPSLSSAILSCLISIALWTALAMGEEGLNRGYAFVQVSRAISFWPAAVLSSAWFMVGHLGNSGETTLGLVATGLIGLALAYSLLRTGSLWFATGFHAAWNFAQSFVFGFPNSGSEPPASLLLAAPGGTPILTGGTAGPEASILILPAMVVLVLVIRRAARTERSAATWLHRGR